MKVLLLAVGDLPNNTNPRVLREVMDHVFATLRGELHTLQAYNAAHPVRFDPTRPPDAACLTPAATGELS